MAFGGLIWKIFTPLMKSLDTFGVFLLVKRPTDDVDTAEELSAFVRHERQVYAAHPRSLRHEVLMPRRIKGRLETSICRTQDLVPDQVWRICKRYFDSADPRPAVGRGCGPASAVMENDLSFDVDRDPHPWHACIVGWHDSSVTPEDEKKHHWKSAAQKMAKKFSYEPRVPSGPKAN